jgi:hypothetical protein
MEFPISCIGLMLDCLKIKASLGPPAPTSLLLDQIFKNWFVEISKSVCFLSLSKIVDE